MLQEFVVFTLLTAQLRQEGLLKNLATMEMLSSLFRIRRLKFDIEKIYKMYNCNIPSVLALLKKFAT